jgi:DNA-binding NarL/FixJ family response regulator
MDTIRILIVDDHPALRAGVKLMLESTGLCTIVGAAANGAEALELHAATQPDITLLDLRLPDMDGYEVLRTLCARDPGTKVIMFSSSFLPHEVDRSRILGAWGYLPKDVELTQLRQTLLTVQRGSPCWPQLNLHRPAGTLSLTHRELEVLHHLTRGLTNEEIGKALGRSPETIKSHLKALLRKLGASDRTEAVAIAYQRGLISTS